MNKKIRILGFVLTMLVILAVAGKGIKSLMVSEPPREIEGYHQWDAEVVAEMRSLPVQDGGRIKPFQSLARRYMYAMHGDRGMKILVNGEKVKLTPTEWLMDVMFRPDLSHELPTFRVDNSDILIQFDIDVKTLRDRYSFNQLKPHLEGVQAAHEKVQEKRRLDPGSLSNEDEQMYAFTRLVQGYTMLRNPFILTDSIEHNSGYSSMQDYFVSNDNYVEELEGASSQTFDLIGFLDGKIISDAVLMRRVGNSASFSKLILNPTGNERAWTSIGSRFSEVSSVYDSAFQIYSTEVLALKQKYGALSVDNIQAFFGEYIPLFKVYTEKVKTVKISEQLRSEIEELENLQLAFSSGNAGKQRSAIVAFKEKYADQIDFGDEGGSISGEIALNKMSYFNNGIAILLFAGILMIAMCLTSGTMAGKVLYWVVFGLVSLACLFTVAGIVHRSVIMDRSPIGTLYDTMPFIVGTGLILLLLIEWIHKKGVMLAVGIVFGVAVLFLAKSFEVMDASDTMDPLVAVLKSNYWLSTHVVMITLGYMGGIVAAIISHFYLIGRVFGVIDDKETKRYLTTIVYGMIAFTLLFSLIGTILGGIWAADSWGRFWGWDPKENGALLIVIWMLVILHARLGGYIREIGLHVCSVFGFIVIVFSWWHVNFLGIGLHNYGFTSADAMDSIWMFYIMEFVIILAGMFMAMIVMVNKSNAKIDKEVVKLAAEQLP